MTDDRDRRAALDFARKNADRWGADDVENLAAFRAAARAEAHARAIEQAAEVVTTCWKCSASVHASPLPHCLDECSPQRFEEGDEAPYSSVESAIRTLAPDPDLVVVRRGGEERT